MRTQEATTRRETARDARAESQEPAKPEATGSTLSLARSPFAYVDRWLPERSWPFVATIVGIALAVWAAGGALATARGRWLASREWLVQPLYLAVHFALVRAFVTSYAANFLAGCSHLRMTAADAERRVVRAVGWRSLVAALVLAAPLVAIDVAWATSAEETAARTGLGEGGAFGAADGLMVGVWALEWVLNAYVWALVVAFLWQTMAALKRHPFREPVESVLREKHYRPFLLMTAQGASLTALFAGASFGYVLLTRGALSDYAGLWVTGGLVFVGFVPAWARLKGSLGDVVAQETRRLDDDIAAGEAALDGEGRALARTIPDLAREVRVMRSILRVEHLQRLHGELGKSEAQAVVLRLVAPVLTILYRFVKPF